MKNERTWVFLTIMSGIVGILIGLAIPLMFSTTGHTPLDVTVIHSQTAAFDSINIQPGSSDVMLNLLNPVNADSKQGNKSFFAKTWTCLGAEFDKNASEFKILRRGIVYKVTYQILGIYFSGGPDGARVIQMRCLHFEELPVPASK